jgi:enoyl-CoA hydratase
MTRRQTASARRVRFNPGIGEQRRRNFGEAWRMTLAVTTQKMAAHIDGAIGWLVFNNPERRNAVSTEMWRAVPEILDAFESEPAVRVIVLRGAGDRAFVSGLDISQFEDEFSSSAAATGLEELSARANQRIQASPKPTIAMIDGFCIGAGVQIAASCDIRIAADRATFAITAAKLGLGYPVLGVRRLLDIVGPNRVKEVFFTARQFSAAEAERMGLADRVVPAADLERDVRAYCNLIAANAPLTIKAVKYVVDRILPLPSDDALSDCEKTMRACFDSADYVEGRRAFREKRKPLFTGR